MVKGRTSAVGAPGPAMRAGGGKREQRARESRGAIRTERRRVSQVRWLSARRISSSWLRERPPPATLRVPLCLQVAESANKGRANRGRRDSRAAAAAARLRPSPMFALEGKEAEIDEAACGRTFRDNL
jgi:hypothetical protein